VTIDPASLPKHFNAKKAEDRWNRLWEDRHIYRYDPAVDKEHTFAVDTPPLTVSGSLHIGHVFSYTHTDVIVRYQRMKGRNIYYPMGWDDNGLATERRVQNYYHVACNPELPYREGLQVRQATARARKSPALDVSRRNFTELCHRLTREDEKAFMTLWQRIGLSVDWRENYATIDEHCGRLAQMSFLDLYEKGHIYSSEAPTMWDVAYQTAVAQAELEDRSISGSFYNIAFGIQGEDRTFTIATTRPELLAACVGIAAHPDDDRYRNLFGKEAITPLFRVPVPIFASNLADPEKGTGILMVCTFGDQTDVAWWKERRLALKQIIGLDGRMLPATFGCGGWDSTHPEAANHYYAQLVGKTVGAARTIVVRLLSDPLGAATGSRPPLQGKPQIMTHDVKFYEKGDQPLEFIPTRQWFVRLLDKIPMLLEKGSQVSWHPRHMHSRYQNWTENLLYDWCISRQRYFGVPFPVWYPLDGEGKPCYADPILPDPSQLPIDPMVDVPPSYDGEQRDASGGFSGEGDIFDTWFTSSLTPQIASHWGLSPDRHRSLFPMDIRPQGHEIIRTWAFYTIVKAALHEDTIPWSNVILSGWVLDPDRKKMSKSKGNVVTPMAHIEKYTADGVRYWAASARLGTDTAFDEKMLKVGKRLVTKLYNAGKFVLSQGTGISPITEALDLAFIHHLQQMVDRVTAMLEQFDFAHALAETERFFWQQFTDNYIELAKNRAKGLVDVSQQAQGSAIAGLRLGMNVLLRLFAPMLPYVTEEIWSWAFAEETGWESIHTASWPQEADFGHVRGSDDPACFHTAMACLGALRKHRTTRGLSMSRAMADLTVAGNQRSLERLAPVVGDVMSAAHVGGHRLVADAGLGDDQFMVGAD